LIPKAQELAASTATQTREVVIPGAQELAASAAAQTREVIIPKAQELASTASSAAASTASATVAKASELTAINTSQPHHFTTPASSAPMEAHYEINPTASPTQSSPVTYVDVKYPEVTPSPTAPSDLTGVARAGEIAGSTLGAISGVATGAVSYVQSSLPSTSVGDTHSQTSYAARAGELTGAAVGAVGGTLSTAAALAKGAVFGAPSSESRDVSTTEVTGPGYLASTGAKASEVAGTVVGSIATVAGAAKNVAVAAVGKVYGGNTGEKRTVGAETDILQPNDHLVSSAPKVDHSEETASFLQGTDVSPFPTANLKNSLVMLDGPLYSPRNFDLPRETGTSYVDQIPSFTETKTDNISSLPSVGTDAGLLSDDAIRAFALPASERSVGQQVMVDRLLAERDLTDVGQPNTEFGTANMSSALPADEITSSNDIPDDKESTTSHGPGSDYRGDVSSTTLSSDGLTAQSAMPAYVSNLSDVPSDEASIRSIPPASLGHGSMSDEEAYESGHHFIADVVAPTEVTPTLASHSPATSTIPEEVDGNKDDSSTSSQHDRDLKDGKKPRKSHALYDKTMGKLQSGVGKLLKSEHLVEHGHERVAAGAAEMNLARETAKKQE